VDELKEFLSGLLLPAFKRVLMMPPYYVFRHHYYNTLLMRSLKVSSIDVGSYYNSSTNPLYEPYLLFTLEGYSDWLFEIFTNVYDISVVKNTQRFPTQKLNGAIIYAFNPYLLGWSAEVTNKIIEEQNSYIDNVLNLTAGFSIPIVILNITSHNEDENNAYLTQQPDDALLVNVYSEDNLPILDILPYFSKK
jgi:hypothetical protein